MQTCTSPILSIFEHIFNPELCQEMAYNNGFIQRCSSIITGVDFLMTSIVPSQGLNEDSLDGLCQRMRELNSNIDITASALCQRINNKSSVEFMKIAFKQILKEICNRFNENEANKFLGCFNIPISKTAQ